MLISITEENYIKAIYSLNESNNGSEVSTTQLSSHLRNKAGSVSDMLQRLHEKQLIDYRKYHGVKLTKKGASMALQIVRKHRLWEVFLVDKLKFKWDEVHDIAEQLEHIQSDELIRRLDEFLGKPKHDPHGDPIPDAKGVFQMQSYKELSKCNIKDTLVFSGVKEHSKEFLQHISKLGFKLGASIRIISKNAFDNLIEIRIESGKSLFIGEKTAANILVEEKK